MTIETDSFSFGTEISGCEMVDRTRGFAIMGYIKGVHCTLWLYR